MVHGDQDTKIPIAEAQKFFTAIGSKNKKLRIFMGGDHGMTDVPRRVREEFLRDVAEWFSNTL
jgi:alpha-beta hydrolase superfamily lysophospholipase